MPWLLSLASLAVALFFPKGPRGLLLRLGLVGLFILPWVRAFWPSNGEISVRVFPKTEDSRIAKLFGEEEFAGSWLMLQWPIEWWQRADAWRVTLQNARALYQEIDAKEPTAAGLGAISMWGESRWPWIVVIEPRGSQHVKGSVVLSGLNAPTALAECYSVSKIVQEVGMRTICTSKQGDFGQSIRRGLESAWLNDESCVLLAAFGLNAAEEVEEWRGSIEGVYDWETELQSLGQDIPLAELGYDIQEAYLLLGARQSWGRRLGQSAAAACP